MERSKAISTNEDIADGEDKYRLVASMAFMIVVIIVGVPMWWKTTEVYRVSLPSADIMSLSDEPLEIANKIAIFSFEKSRAELLVKELTEIYANNDLWRPNFVQIVPFEKAFNTKTPAALESLLLKQEEIRAGDFIFIEWPKLQEEVLLTSDRSALIRSDTSASRIKHVINLLILQTHRIQQILNEDHRHGVKSEAPQTEYDVVVSILNPRPDIMNAKWNVRMAVETYIAPFLKEVSQISNYTLTTQWKYQLPFEADLKQVRDSSKLGRHYALGETDLPHIITSIEKNLGVGITAKPAINLVVYITPCDIAPVHIYNRHNKQATRQKVDSFISPKWGGIIIANPPAEACVSYNAAQQPVEFYVNTNDVMQIMLYQLQKLLDINVEFNIDGVKTVALEQIEPRRWEYEAYIRRSAVMHITTASNTLQSLIKLLDNISYIVINDDVGQSINNAYKIVLLAKQTLASGNLLAASNYARSAFIASEHAFFDASLLAQLYFPDEQKYAIYIPLFLPIMVPVITSFTMIRKLVTKLRKAKKEKCT
ncbi:PREDICTED: GPI transamidase component PIG-S isoform X1 [Rhagoletis zephyria]|uniref:GPI transamidase component PIG-S isoform X1 n=1 Tax=Rhagoletis zephyria TaxID=28612 RepID=UPI0008112718|nr:PREDICTED: GPI transamidase component PIG-S isoform X1 [Rhagoletis zephyria]XP_017483617.1 PREDICTED: GPI transamidase component PIG-S isoform X1 [Rhagoletis zephyria]